MKKELSIIIVNYNTKDLLRNCLNSIIENTKGINYEIIVVDNASSDGSVERLKKEFPQVKIICNTENLGFAKANNQGIRITRGETVLFLNPDTLILNGAIPKMLDFIKRQKSVGVVGPKLFKNINREFHPSARRFTKPLYVFLSYLPLAGFVLWMYNNFFFNKRKIREVDWLWGAVLLVKKEVINKIGGFDENFFMYSEEEDFCLRAHRSGYRVFYFPKAEVIHLKGKSAENRKIETSRYFWKSKLYFFKKYYSMHSVHSFKTYFSYLLKLKMFFKIIPFDECHKEIIRIIEKN
ncbi:MAG: glycosyltransferase family 2 protein [Candidatus Helarchaeota archaeon]